MGLLYRVVYVNGIHLLVVKKGSCDHFGGVEMRDSGCR